jgi:hypothetical protein
MTLDPRYYPSTSASPRSQPGSAFPDLDRWLPGAEPHSFRDPGLQDLENNAKIGRNSAAMHEGCDHHPATGNTILHTIHMRYSVSSEIARKSNKLGQMSLVR